MSLIHSAITALDEQDRATAAHAAAFEALGARALPPEPALPQTSKEARAHTQWPSLMWLWAAVGLSIGMAVTGAAAVWSLKPGAQTAAQTERSAPSVPPSSIPLAALSESASQRPSADAPAPTMRNDADSGITRVFAPQPDRVKYPDVVAAAHFSVEPAPRRIPVEEPSVGVPLPQEQTRSTTPATVSEAKSPAPAADGTPPRNQLAVAGGRAANPQPQEGNVSSEKIERLAGEIRGAIQAQQYDAAATLLAQLGQHLPVESITLLRLKAWHALRLGNAEDAVVLYQLIAERLPDDESAVINLSVAHWTLGRQEEARRTIAALAERRPDSEAVRHAAARLGANQ